MTASPIKNRKSKITNPKSPTPVSVLVGFLGAGKTTLLNHLLSANHGRKIAIIVNEFGEINIDSKLVRHTTEKVIQMSNGCICCTLREDLLTELAASGRVRQLPVDQLSDIISNLVYGTMFTNQFAGRRQSIKKQVDNILDILLNGILVK